MADMDAIRNGLADNLRTLALVEDDVFAVSAYMQTQNLGGPTLEVYPAKFRYDEAAFRTDEIRFKVRAVVGNVITDGAQKLLDRLLDTSGDDSVKAALEGNARLGGLTDDLIVEECSGYRLYPAEGQPNVHLLGCEWTVCIIATR